MTELLPLLLFFQAISDRVELERSLEEEFLLEMNCQTAAMSKSRIISWELMREIREENKIESAKRRATAPAGISGKWDRPKRKNGQRS